MMIETIINEYRVLKILDLVRFFKRNIFVILKLRWTKKDLTSRNDIFGWPNI